MTDDERMEQLLAMAREREAKGESFDDLRAEIMEHIHRKRDEALQAYERFNRLRVGRINRGEA